MHVSARKSIDIRRVQLVRARERAKDRKWIFRNVIFPAEGNEARARVFFADTREFRILNGQGRSMGRGKRGKKKRETIVKHLSFALAPRVPFEGAWILRGCVIRVEFFETL